MNTTVYLIRHGEVAYQYSPEGSKLIYGPDIPLGDIGREQLTDVANQFLHDQVRLDTLFCSPYRRAEESAAIIHNKLGAPIVTVQDLHDLWAPAWVGKTLDYLRSLNGNIHNIPPLSADQETLPGMAMRVRRAIDTLLAANQGKTFGIVSHGDPLASYIHHLLHPDALPNVDRDNNYPGKGQVWRVCFDAGNNLTSCEQYKVRSKIPEINF